jgi:hypothetical protein
LTSVGELRWYGHNLGTQYKDIAIVVSSDWHLDNPLFSLKHINRTIDFVKSIENARLILGGDLAEAVTKLSKGDIYHQSRTPQDQRDDIIKILLPVKDKILGMVTGNHEMRITNESGIDLSKDIAKALGVPYRPEGILLKIVFGGGNSRHDNSPYVFWGYTTHGYGGARTKSAKAVKVERLSTWVRADFYTMSHDHVVNVAPDLDLIPDNRGAIDAESGFMTGKITAHRKMLVKTNAYLKWGGYSEMGGFPPTDLSTPVIWLLTPKSDKWDMTPDRPRQGVKVLV